MVLIALMSRNIDLSKFSEKTPQTTSIVQQDHKSKEELR